MHSEDHKSEVLTVTTSSSSSDTSHKDATKPTEHKTRNNKRKRSADEPEDATEASSSSLPPPKYVELPSRETSRTYEVVFISHSVKDFSANLIATSPFHLATNCAFFVHTTWDLVQPTMNALTQLGFEKSVIWRVVRLRGNDRVKISGSGDKIASPTSSFVVLASRGDRMRVAHNNMPFEITASANDAEKDLLDMAADLFSFDVRLYIMNDEHHARITRASEYDTWVRDKGFLTHKPFTPKSARKCRMFAAWLQQSSAETLRAAQSDLDTYLDPACSLPDRLNAWERSISFLPEPDAINIVCDLGKSERWQRRLSSRITFLRRKQQNKIRRAETNDVNNGVNNGDASESQPKKKTKGFAAARVVSDELATFVRQNFPDEPIPICEQTNRPKLARTRVVQLINEYVQLHNLKNPEHKNMFEFGRDEALMKLLKPSDGCEDFLKMGKLLNPHFLTNSTLVEKSQ